MKTVYLSVTLPNYLAALKLIGVAAADAPDTADALLLPGGGDLDPAFYGQSIASCRDIDRARDARELALTRSFLAWQRPVFGICRGMQVINVALGGTLHQHVGSHSQIGGADRLHETRAVDDTLCRLYGERFAVNSAHHQSVDRLGDSLEAVQWAADGVVEAIRHQTLPVFAVQWHPERLCGRFARSDAADGAALLRSTLSGA